MRTFFVPGHITGFFELIDHKDPLKTGSRGCGVVLDKGVNTGISIKDSDETVVRVFYNRRPCVCQTSKSVVHELLKGTCGTYEIDVHHFSDLPLEYGFGVSASGALGTAFAMNDILDLNLDFKKIGESAHAAEVINNTGRGDVSAELSRGLVIRTKEGAPGTGSIKSIPLEGFIVCFIIGKPLATKTVLVDPAIRNAINTVGSRCITAFLSEPSPELFMELSRKFTLETGLVQKTVAKSVKTLEKNGVTAGMCMLGNAVFMLTDEPEKVLGILDYPSITLRPLKTDIRSWMISN